MAAHLADQATMMQWRDDLVLGVTVHQTICDSVGSTGFL
jgi:hypothetical protein